MTNDTMAAPREIAFIREDFDPYGAGRKVQHPQVPAIGSPSLLRP
ncbi:MAG: hypothetical protein P8130_05640 [Deltaproteobacteria bacterium]